MKIWSNKFFQSIVFVFITISFGIVMSRLDTLQLVLERSYTVIDKSVTDSLVKDVKTIRIIGAIIWAITIGLYNNFIHTINKKNSDNIKL